MNKSESKRDGQEEFPKDVTEASVYADLYSFVAVIYVFCVPHFYHAFHNSLIINEFNILHRQVKSAYKQYTSITKPLYLFDNQLKTAKSFVG